MNLTIVGLGGSMARNSRSRAALQTALEGAASAGATTSGAFKNALDWLHLLGDRDPPFLHDKVIGLISAAGGTHGLQAINTMEFAVRALRGWAVPYVVPVAAAWRVFDGTGNVQDPEVELQLRTLGGEIARRSPRRRRWRMIR